jgi:diadenosine tetraphosphatase ApaH/serine/threonine PP2A family protein phosphatase
VDAKPAGALVAGHLLAAISTSIVGILRDHHGRGPMRAIIFVATRQLADPSLIRSRGDSRGLFREPRGSPRNSPLRVWAVP